jgi:hypothetical protein
MSASAIIGRRTTSLEEAAAACKILVLCDDATARTKAMEVFERVSAGLQSELTFDISSWDFVELEEKDSGRTAAEAAAGADIIMFSTHGTELPDAVGRWLDGIQHSNERSAGALAFMPIDPNKPSTATGKILPQLTKAAQRLGMDFIPFTETQKKIKSTERPITGPYDHWGLNE